MRLIAVTNLRAIAAFGITLAVWQFAPARAEEPISFQPACSAQPIQNEPRAFTAKCEIAPLAGLRIARVTYRREGQSQPATEAVFLPFDASDRQAAILFLIDRSGNKRSRTIAIGAGDAVRLSDAAQGPAFHSGLASMLGDRLDILAPIGSTHEAMVRAAANIHADSSAMSNVRAVLDAIKLLGQSDAARRVLVIATDGKPEDKALASDDVIKAARSAGIVLVTLGYREHTGDGPELGSVKKLAEGTGGFYAEPLLPSTRVEDAVVTRFGQFVGSGGVATFPLDKSDPRARYEIKVEIEGAAPLVGLYTPEITLPGLKSAVVKPSIPTEEPTQLVAAGPTLTTNAPPSLVASATTGSEPDDPDSFGGIMATIGSGLVSFMWAKPLTTLCTLVLAAGVLYWSFVRFIERSRNIKVFAWLELLDQRRTRVPVTAPGVRLGRHSDNDIRFRDKSVHRHHAILSRDLTTGHYLIADVTENQTRSNGVLVNGELVHQPVVLGNGDTVELGDVSFRFLYA